MLNSKDEVIIGSIYHLDYAKSIVWHNQIIKVKSIEGDSVWITKMSDGNNGHTSIQKLLKWLTPLYNSQSHKILSNL